MYHVQQQLARQPYLEVHIPLNDVQGDFVLRGHVMRTVLETYAPQEEIDTH